MTQIIKNKILNLKKIYYKLTIIIIIIIVIFYLKSNIRCTYINYNTSSVPICTITTSEYINSILVCHTYLKRNRLVFFKVTSVLGK